MSPSSRLERWLAWATCVVLLLLHLDFWREQRAELYFGWLPEELLYRLVWMTAATAWLWWFCARIWPDDPESDG